METIGSLVVFVIAPRRLFYISAGALRIVVSNAAGGFLAELTTLEVNDFIGQNISEKRLSPRAAGPYLHLLGPHHHPGALRGPGAGGATGAVGTVGAAWTTVGALGAAGAVGARRVWGAGGRAVSGAGAMALL
jgi:hypothetical protein